MTEGDGFSRNFRSSYYEKLGFCDNEEKDILDLLLTSSPFNPEILSDLCERFDLDRRCVETWKLLLGTECGRRNPFDEYENVRRVRAEHFQSLRHHLEILLRHNIATKERNPGDHALIDQQTSKQKGKPADEITLMYLLETGRLNSLDIAAQLNSPYCRKLSATASFFVNVANDLQEAFFLFRNFTRKLEENKAFGEINDKL